MSDKICKKCRHRYQSNRSLCNTCYYKQYYKKYPGKKLEDQNRVKKFKHQNKEKTKTYMREYSLYSQFGITLDDYNDMLAAQHNKCALCLRTNPHNKNLAVDHCHKSGTIRGLLCLNCNLYLRHVDKDPVSFIARLRKYYNYYYGYLLGEVI